MRDKLNKTVRDLMRTFSRPLDPYRPELHYMRGPGPKCAAKRAGLPASAAQATRSDFGVLGEIAKASA
jgi:hypothetical protein